MPFESRIRELPNSSPIAEMMLNHYNWRRNSNAINEQASPFFMPKPSVSFPRNA